jgi:ATP-binding cassette subfamily B protein
VLKQLAPLLPYARRYRRRIALGLGLVVASNLFALAWPYLLKLAIDALDRGITPQGLAAYAGAIVGFSFVGGVGRFFMRELLNGMSRRVENDLRDDYFEHLLRLAPDFYGRVPTGELMSRATNDIPAVRMVIGPAIMYLVNTTVVSAIALTMLILIDPRLTLLAVLPMIIVPPVVIFFGREIHKRFEAIQAQFGRISTMAQENLAGARIVRAYVQEAAQAKGFAELNAEYMHKNLRLARIWGLFHPMLMLLTGLGAVVVLGIGGRDVIMGRITIGDFVAFIFYLMQLIWPMIALGWVINLFERGAASMGRIREIMEELPSIRDNEAPVELAQPLGAVEFRNVSFRYPGTERYVLRDISFRIEPGKTVAIVGPTGSGKSTVVRLIPRLYDPDEGEILLDGTPITRIPLEQLRRLISMVPQEPFLFSETLRSNIAFGLDDGRDGNHIEEAAGIAQLAETIRDFPQGYETQLGERGINLSGGQKQRATLARALTRDAPVLILDDALSSVDTQTEMRILAGLQDVLRRHTSFIVSHRVTAVKDADLILVIDDGEIVERGLHSQLIEADGTYARLLRRQLLEDSLEVDSGTDLAGAAQP